MKKMLITAVIILAGTAWAEDFEEGMAAYEVGQYKLAFVKFKAAAEQGNATAQFGLGVMYDSGQGVVKNNAEAAKCIP